MATNFWGLIGEICVPMHLHSSHWRIGRSQRRCTDALQKD